MEEDLDTNLQRDKHARLCATVNQLVEELVPNAPDYALRETCDQLVRCDLHHILGPKKINRYYR